MLLIELLKIIARVYELETFTRTHFLEAHASEILAIDFSIRGASMIIQSIITSFHQKTETLGTLNLMATGSRDRLIHIFDVKNDFRLIQTLEDHTSSITALQFCDNGRKLMSSAADKSIIFRTLQEVAL